MEFAAAADPVKRQFTAQPDAGSPFFLPLHEAPAGPPAPGMMTPSGYGGQPRPPHPSFAHTPAPGYSPNPSHPGITPQPYGQPRPDSRWFRIERTRWNKSRAARALGLSRQGLLKKLRRYGLVDATPGASALDGPAGGP